MRHCLVIALLAFAAAATSGCATIGYYAQSFAGQYEVLAKRRPIAAVVADPATPIRIRGRLELVGRLREFAAAKLDLPAQGSYASYAAIGRRYVVWNVFATPALSLDPIQSCFPVIGCLSYRGYFSAEGAARHARTLETRGHDVYVGGVAAYSTLGWFDDPVLDTMITWSDTQVARFLFHELAHQKLYVRDDTAFNEAYAEAVAESGVDAWLAATASPDARQAHAQEQRHDGAILTLIATVRDELRTLYSSPAGPDDKRRHKALILTSLRDRYERLRAAGGKDTGYDSWMSSGVNNAKIAAVATYHDDVPAFRNLLAAVSGDFPAFHRASARIGALRPEQRRTCLDGLKVVGPAFLARCQ
jgi:predicted aminopeptidase